MHRPVKTRNYALAVFLVAAAGAVRWALERLFGVTAPTLTFYPAVLIMVLIGGIGPALLAIVLSVILLIFFLSSVTFVNALATSIVFCFSGVLLAIIANEVGKVRAERVRRESEEKYRTVVERANDGIIIVQDGVLKYANPRMAELDGSSIDQLIGSPITDHIHETDMGKVAELSRRRMAGENVPSIYEAVLKRRNGEPVDAELNVGIITYEERPAALVIIRDATERKKAEQALRESEERFTKAFHLSPVGVIITRPDDGLFLDANDAFLAMFGYSREEVVGHTATELRMYADPDERTRLVSAARETGGLRNYEMSARAKTGKIVTVLFSTIMATINKQEYGITTMIDISERKRIEEELRRYREELEKRVEERTEELRHQAEVLEAVNDAIIVVDFAHHIVGWNHGAEQTYGYSRQEVQGKDVTTLLRTNLPAPIEQLMSTVRREGHWEGELIRHAKDGRTVIAQCRWGLQRDVAGGHVAVVEISRDITESKQTEKKLAEQAFLLTNISDAVIAFDLDYRVTYFGKSAERMYGYRADEVIGRPGVEVFQPSYIGTTREAILEQLMSTGKLDTEVTQVTKDGRSITVESHAVLLYDEYGKPMGIVGVNHDITERRRAEEEMTRLQEQLRQSQKMEAIGTLAGGVAHDFNNMLAVIIGNAELAYDDLPGKDGPKHSIGQIIKASKRARDLVKQILTYSRKTESGRTPIHLTPLVKETFKLLRGTVPSTVKMELNIETGEDVIIADPAQIQQVLMNLVTNAAHAMRDGGGVLTVALDNVMVKNASRPDPEMQEGRYVKLSVRDTGTGMTKEVLGRIFDPFFTTKKAEQGTGMGLAVVYGIVKTHEGVITVDSKMGQGSTFDVFIPYARMQPIDEGEELDDIPCGQERILVVDDEPDVGEAVSNTLRRLGYHVTTATGAAEAWNTFSDAPHAFDLVMTDQVMPDLTGIDLAQRMLKARKDLPVILVTGYSETVSNETAKSAGIREFVLKPIDKREMGETIRRVLDGRSKN